MNIRAVNQFSGEKVFKYQLGALMVATRWYGNFESAFFTFLQSAIIRLVTRAHVGLHSGEGMDPAHKLGFNLF